jgi:hypothetical protein
VNNCCRIVHGASSDLSSTELEVLIRSMTGEAYAPESLVVPRGIKALCEDHAMRTTVLASLPTLTRAVCRSGRWGATPIVGSESPAPRSTASNAPTEAPADPATEVRLPPGKGKGRSRSYATNTTCAPARTARMMRSAPSRFIRTTRSAPSRSARTMRRTPSRSARTTRSAPS